MFRVLGDHAAPRPYASATRHHAGRRWRALVAAATLILAAAPLAAQSRRGVVPAGAVVVEPGAADAAREGARGTRVGLIVRLTTPSLVATIGTADRGRRGRMHLDQESPAARQHLAAIDAQQRTFEQALQRRVPRASVGRHLRIALNAVSVLVPPSARDQIAQLPGVEAVYPDNVRQLQTTRSPGLIGAPLLWAGQNGPATSGEGVIIATIDSGIWPEHPSFADPADSGPYVAPEGWNGTRCEFGSDAPGDAPFTCNNKIIGARRMMASYDALQGLQPGEFASARDESGHGTLVASIAAGNGNVAAAVSGNPLGAVSGVAPRAQLAVYKVCGRGGCYDSDAVAAVQQAIVDGVDIIHLPLSGGADPYSDALSLALLDAYNAGVFVVTAAGNNGIGDVAGRHEPWTTTVGATRVDRTFVSLLTVRAGTKSLALYGASIGPGVAASAPIVNAAATGDAMCAASSPATTFTGQIVICTRGGNSRLEKSYNVRRRGAIGMILINPTASSINPDNHYVPTVHLDKSGADQLLAFLAANSGVTATFSQGVAVATAGDIMGSFTSRGGAGQPLGISKPDLVAPGVQILGAQTPRPSAIDAGPAGESFQVLEGTSLASAHVAGAAALLKALYPAWTPDQIKSALMLTATTAVKKESGTTGNQFDYGAGRIQLDPASRPGLAIVPAAGEFMAKRTRLWDVNYPALYVPRMPGVVSTTRTLQNLEDHATTWSVQSVASAGLKLTVPASITVPALGTAALAITLDASTITIDNLGGATIYLIESGGTRVLHIPVVILRKPNAMPISTTCAPTSIKLTGYTDCAIDVANFDSTPAPVTIYDVLPSVLKLVPASVTGAVASGNAVVLQTTLAAGLPGAIDLRPFPPYEGFMSLAGSYAPIACTGSCDDRVFTAPIPAGILFNGVVYTSITISTNGFVQLGGDATASPVNQQLPDPAAPNSVLAPFWTDLHPAGTDGLGGGAMYAGYAAYPSGRTWLVIEWNNVLAKGTTARHTFQVWLQVGGQVEDITYSYMSLDSRGAGGALTVGAESANGSVGKSYYYNGTGTAPTGALNITVTSVAPGPGGTRHLTFRATPLATGSTTHCGVAVRDGSSEVAVSCIPITVTK